MDYPNKYNAFVLVLSEQQQSVFFAALCRIGPFLENNENSTLELGRNYRPLFCSGFEFGLIHMAPPLCIVAISTGDGI